MPRFLPIALAATVAAGSGLAWHQAGRPAQESRSRARPRDDVPLLCAAAARAG